jgi:bacterial/archaeal transporter family protein
MHIPVWLLFALLALLCWGVSGVIQKLSTNAISTELAVLWFSYAMFALSLGVLIGVPLDWHVKRSALVLAAVSGAFNVLGVMTSFAALERGGKASIVIPLTCMYPLVTILLAVLFLHETLTRVQLLGVVLAIVAAVLLSREAPPEKAGL